MREEINLRSYYSYLSLTIGAIVALIVLFLKGLHFPNEVFAEKLPRFLSSFSHPRVLYILVSFSLIFLSSLIIDLIFNIGGLLSKRIKLPFLFSILILLMLPIESVLDLAPIVIIIEFAIYNLFGAYNEPDAARNQLNIGLLIGFASVLQPVMALFFLVFLIGLYVLLSWNVKSFLRTFLGFLTPLWIYLGYLIYVEHIDVFLEAIRLSFQITSLKYFDAKYLELVILAAFILTFIGYEVTSFLRGLNHSLKIRKEIHFLAVFFMSSFVILVFTDSFYLFVALSSLSLPLLLSRIIVTVKRKISLSLYLISFTFFLLIYALQLWIF